MVDELIAEPQPICEVDPRPQTILVVDDDAAQVLALEHRLDKLGFEVLTAHSGAAALLKARSHRPDLVVLDLRLPDMSGFDVCAELADAPETCGTPIIILSAMERPDIVRHSRAVGSEYYVRKPYDPNVLLTLIQRSLDQAL